MNNEDTSGPVDRQRLVDLAVFEYRSLVVRRLGVTAEWRVLEWIDSAACKGQPTVSAEMCQRCTAVSECLAAALASDDRAELRGGLSRDDREHLWAGMERTYREVRDLELMRLDVNNLLSRSKNFGAAARRERNGSVGDNSRSAPPSVIPLRERGS